MLSGRIQLQKEPGGIQPCKKMLKNKNQIRNNKLEDIYKKVILPTRAIRLIHPGIGFPVTCKHTSSVKWLQFLAIKWYVSP